LIKRRYCEKEFVFFAKQLNIVVNTIGFGPAVDQSPSKQDKAFEILRYLVICVGGGTYIGVVYPNGLRNETLSPIWDRLHMMALLF
jgi:hypothetical protein